MEQESQTEKQKAPKGNEEECGYGFPMAWLFSG
jgi:hypothetical protein